MGGFAFLNFNIDYCTHTPSLALSHTHTHTHTHNGSQCSTSESGSAAVDEGGGKLQAQAGTRAPMDGFTFLNFKTDHFTHTHTHTRGTF